MSSAAPYEPIPEPSTARFEAAPPESDAPSEWVDDVTDEAVDGLADAGQEPARVRANKRRSGAAARPVLTGKAVSVVVAGAIMLLLLAGPIRTFLGQRAQIAELTDRAAAAQARVDVLTAESARLQDPAYIQSLVRERLHYVMPGEIGYTVLDPSEAPAPLTPAQAAAAKLARTPWYEKLWGAMNPSAVKPKPVPTAPRTDAPR